MKKHTYILVVLAMTLLMGCSREKPEDKERANEQAKPKIEAKKPAEAPIGTKTQIVCDKFDLVTKVTGSTLDLSVDTDLPDNTVVMINVSRAYLEKGNTATCSLDCFSEKSTVGKWKS